MVGGRVRRLRHILIAGIACAAFFPATCGPAFAADESDGVEVEGTIGLVSDYRFRGIPLSDGKPALQAGIEIERAGWFAGSWGSTVADREHSHWGVEFDVYAGRRGQVAGLNYSVTGYAYLTGLHQSAYVEIQTLVGRNIGPARIEGELAYAPPQRGASGNVYLGGRASLPIRGTGFSLLARGGYENGYYARKFDWEAGASWSRGPLVLSATLTGARERRSAFFNRGGTAVVLSAVRTW